MTYNVRDFGAVGDGVALDSPAIQSVLDLCKEKGGGTVYIPAGQYMCASMRIYDNTCVHLDAGATVYLYDKEEAFTKPRGKYDDFFSRDARELVGERLSNMQDDDFSLGWMSRISLQCYRNRTDNLFCAINAKNVTIEGEGTLNGRQKEFFLTEEYLEDMRLPRWMRRPEGHSFFLPRVFRPHSIVIFGCENVTLRDFKLIDSPLFNIRILDTTEAHISHLYIKGDRRFINSDGINIAGSRNVFVDHCSIHNGDDCIAISDGEIQPRTQNTENVIVTDCVFDSGSNMARIFCGIDLDPFTAAGVELPKNAWDIAKQQRVRNVILSNCLMLGGSCCANIHTCYGGIENIQILNCTTLGCHRAPIIFIGAKDDAYIKNVRIDGLRSEATASISMLGMDGAKVEDITVANCEMLINPTTSLFGMGQVDSMNDYWALDYGPYNINMRHVHDVTLQNVTLKWGKDDLDDFDEISPAYLPPYYANQWREDLNPNRNFPAVYGYDVQNVTCSGMVVSGHGDCEAYKFEKSENIEIR